MYKCRKKNKCLPVSIFIFSIFFSLSAQAQAQCLQSFQNSLGGSATDIAIDVADAGNGQFFVAGTTTSYGAGGTDILISKMSPGGGVLWTKVYGASADEIVRKIKSTSDSGLLIIGQTRSFDYSQGEILCFKIDANGQLLWSRKFGLGTLNGELGMNIIQTTDGGFALVNIINVNGDVADLSIIRLDNNANIIWSKRFDSHEGDDGVGILQQNDTLVISGDVDNNSAYYNATMLKVKLSDGSFIAGKKLVPVTRGIFDPNVFADNNNGYFVSAHIIDGNLYDKMQPVIIKLDNNLNITNTYSYKVPAVYTNDFYTGFSQVANGFVACASTQSTPKTGYLFNINNNGAVIWSKKFQGKNDRSLYNLEHIGNKIITIGSDNSNGNGDDFFVAGFDDDGYIDSLCHPDTSQVTISHPLFTESNFTWDITDQTFANVSAPISVSDVLLIPKSLCDACVVDTVPIVVPSFIVPDTVCVNAPFNIKNTTTGASTYYWSFCTANVGNNPTGTNLGTFNNAFQTPVFMDIVSQNGNYYGFVTDFASGELTRLDFGSSILNTPSSTNLGSFGGILPFAATEGIQVVQNQGKWYALIVGGIPNSKIVKIDFGTSLTNHSPTATDWGNIGNLDLPHDLSVFQQNNNWYGITINKNNNTITRFDFTNSFDNTPTGVNLGNLGNINLPTGMFAIKDSTWHVFIVNSYDEGVNPADYGTITRLDFGNSLLNIPTAVNLGDLNNTLHNPRDIAIIKFCGESVGFVVNHRTNDIVKLDFNDNLESVPSAVSIGNIAGFNFPHSISKLFRVGADIYSFIPNATDNTISRIKFPGCTNASVPNSAIQNPPPVKYNTPGVYNINLTIDDGLPTQNSLCKQVVVLGGPNIKLSGDSSVCTGDSAHLKASGGISYQWTPTTGLTNPNDSVITIKIASNTEYYVTAKNAFGCTAEDSLVVKVSNCTNTCVPTFEKLYGGKKGEVAYSIINNPDGSSVIAGTTTSFGNGGIDGYLQKIDTSGNILWSKTIGGTGDDYFYTVHNTKDGGYILAGSTTSYGGSPNGVAWMVKADGNGNVQWTRKYDDGNANGSIATDVAATTDGGYVLSGINDYTPGLSQAMIIKTDNAGAVTWSKEFYSGNSCGANGIIEDADTLVVSVYQYGQGSTMYNGVIMKLDRSTGNIIWARNYDIEGESNTFLHIYKTSNGYVVNDADAPTWSFPFEQVAVNTDKNGAPLSLTKVSDNSIRNQGAFAYTNDGGFIVTQYDNNSTPSAYIIKTSSTGVFQWAKIIAAPGAQYIYDIKQLLDNSYIMAGTKNNTPVISDSSDIYVIKTDATGGITGCSPGTNTALITSPPYSYNPDFTWASVSDMSFTPTSVTSTAITPAPFQKLICGSCIVDSIVTCNVNPDFSFTQNVCNPTTLQFQNETQNTSLVSWDFGNGKTAGNNLTPSITYGSYGIYTVKLVVQTTTGCTDSISKNITVALSQDSLIITNDTTLCASGILQLNSLQALSYCWSPAAGLSATNIANPVATVTKSSTYYLTEQTVKNNLIVNGDFSQGNTGFTSGYSAASPNTVEGQYWVGTNPNQWNAGMSACTDHTSGSGNMMLVNGATQTNVKVWSQTVNILPNTNYAFSTWIQTISNLGNPAQLQFSINGKLIGNIFQANANTCTWGQFYTTWNSGNSTSAVISIVNENSIAFGNDFALDDISFSEMSLKYDSIKITVVSLPQVLASGDTSICSGGIAQLNASSPVSVVYSWLPVTGLSNPAIANPTASPSSTTTYYLQVKDSNKCSATDSVTVTVTPQPTVKTLSDTTIIICRDTTIQLITTATNANTYSWSPGLGLSDSTVLSPFASPPNNIQYVITVNPGSKCFARDTVNITVKPTPSVTASGDTTICGGGSVQLSSNASPNVTYSWTPATGLSDPSSSNPVATPISSVVYIVQVMYADNCSARDSVSIAVTPQPLVTTIADTAICSGSTIQLVTNSTNVSSFSWYPPDGLSDPSSPSPVASPLNSTQYVVTANPGSQCSAKDTVNIAVNPSPSVTVSNDTTICNGGSAQFTTTASANVTYSWLPATGLSDPAAANPDASPTATTVYYVTVTGTDQCTGRDSISLTVNPKPVFGITPPQANLCTGDTLQLSASGGDVYQWYPATNITDTSLPVTKVYPATTTTYYVAITNTTCKITDTVSSTVNTSQKLNVNVTKSNDIDCILGQATLHATGGTQYTWYPLTAIDNPYTANPVVSPLATTTYYVTVKNNTSCTGTDSVVVQVLTNDAQNGYLVASAFTPNGDGVNDCFGVRLWGGIRSIEFSVYDRWGLRIFHTYNPSDCWDGTYRGIKQPPGTFVYQIKATTICGNVYRKGTVVLIR